MRRSNDENEKIQEQAGKNMVVILEKWKKKVRRLKVYRACLVAMLMISCAALTGTIYYRIDSSIPSVINIRAGEEESFRLGVPARAEIISVSDQGSSNIPAGAVDIDLSRTVTMKMNLESDYRMQVKLFGFLPIKQVSIQVIEDQTLIPVGVPIGIYVKTDGVLVVGTGEFQGENGLKCSPGKNIVKSGDYIRRVNGQEINKKNELSRLVEDSGGNPVILTVERDGETMDVQIKPERDEAGSYKIGVWVRDDAQGVGGGTLYETSIIEIKKGAVGDPGEMTGMIVYTDDHILGSISENSVQGIFGTCNIKALALGTNEPLPIGLKQEIVKGPAQILCTVDGEAQYYDVEITEVHLDHDNVNRGIELKVTDKRLLEITGGIVQGMSGSPIIQNGKFIGAVTHVLVQDSARGYGIFIENMLQH